MTWEDVFILCLSCLMILIAVGVLVLDGVIG